MTVDAHSEVGGRRDQEVRYSDRVDERDEWQDRSTFPVVGIAFRKGGQEEHE